MNNRWARYLEPISAKETERKPFLQQLQKFEAQSHCDLSKSDLADQIEEPVETVSIKSPETTEVSIESDMPVENCDNLTNEIELIPELSPEIQHDIEYDIPRLLESENPIIVEEDTIVEGDAPSETMGETIEPLIEVVPDKTDVAEYVGEGTEVMCWMAKSHKGHAMRLNTYPNDFVRLIEYDAGELVLKYLITGEDIEDTSVASVGEAENIINDDNEVTEDLYSDIPELKWVKVTECEQQ